MLERKRNKGKEMSGRKFLFEYRFEGDTYGLDIVAADADEAKRKLSAMGLARYCGEIHAIIHVPFGGWLSRLFGKRDT
jgi:hypothetical protein